MIPVPKTRPKLTREELKEILQPYNIENAKYPLVVVGIRGYYEDSMGKVGTNDRGIYDDALFIISPSVYKTFNGNTDPSKIRTGSGTGEKKGIASLAPGAWYVHMLSLHKGKYLALCQRAGSVRVFRDGINGPYEETGNFGINIHKGDYNSTSSEGCQTIHPDQWTEFIQTVSEEGKRLFGADYQKHIYPYILIEHT